MAEFFMRMAGDSLVIKVAASYWNSDMLRADKEVRKLAAKKGFGGCAMEGLPDFDDKTVAFEFRFTEERGI